VVRGKTPGGEGGCAGGTERDGIRVKTGGGTRTEAARLESEEMLLRRLFESSPELVEMIQQLLPRGP
jgi:hypothetical protein